MNDPVKPEPEKQECTLCDGTGTCHQCEADADECEWCDGSGECADCEGSGTLDDA